MAKSLRSKWRRKCRAIKRVRYGAKELERLKKTLGISDNATDVEMADITKIATVVDAKTIKENTKEKEDAMPESSDRMQVESARVYNKKTLRDQDGNYPEWMSSRKIQKHKKGRAKSRKGTVKRTGKRLTRREIKKASRKQNH